MTAATAVWLYSVTSAGRPDLTGLAGVAGEPVRLLDAGELCAVVGDVPLTDFAEQPLRAHLEDLRWLEQAARAHHRVIDTVARAGDVVPLRFATLYHDDAAVRAALAERAGDFVTALERVAGRAEWGVKAYVDPQALRTAAAASGPGADADRPGTAYLLQRKAHRQQEENARHAAADRAAGIRAALSGSAVATAPHPPQDPRLAEFEGWMILNDSYLVDQHGTREFSAAFAACEQDFPEVRLELSGPWPPYSFTADGPAPGEG